jgi:hypothetical protein
MIRNTEAKMIQKNLAKTVSILLVLAASTAMLNVYANPILVPGTWVGIGPQQSGNSEVWYVRVDPNNSNVIYACCSGDGLKRTTDGGSTWSALPTGNCVTGLEIDPANSQHLYISYAFTAGGFWETTDGGATWLQHPTPASSDIGLFRVDPANFKHVLVSFHYCSVDTIAFLESTDGGNNWKIHHVGGVGGGGTKGIHFLHFPALGIGDEKSWLVTPEGGNVFRTTDAGATWTSTDVGAGGPHGGEKTTYYTAQGVLYIALNPTGIRSSDNGATWTKLAMPNAMYEAIMGDGNTLYSSNPESNNVPVITSPENNGLTWTAGAQTFGRGPTDLFYDAKNHIMYGACRAYGVYALKVNDPNTGMFLSNAMATPRSIFDNATTTVTFSIDATAQGSVTGVTLNLSPLGGNAGVSMTRTSGNTYSATYTVQPGVRAGDHLLLVTATDNNGHTLLGTVPLSVLYHNAPVLVSRNKTVVVSSTQDAAFPGSNAVDGNIGTRWASAGGDPQWIYVDLGSSMPVNQVILVWEQAYASGYKIQVSDDATTWTDVFATTTGDGGTDSINITPANGRYVRMYGTVRGSNYAYSLFEFEIYTPGPGTTKALVLRQNTAYVQPGFIVSRNHIDVHASQKTAWQINLYNLSGAKIAHINGTGTSRIALDKGIVGRCLSTSAGTQCILIK